jgi:hypothetical protein
MEFVISTQDDIIMEQITTFFQNKKNVLRNKIIPIIQGNSEISLRLIEKFVTGYCNKNKITINKRNGDLLCVHEAYKYKLRSFGKKKLDIFQRNRKILFKYTNKLYLETTIGQLNFFKFIIETEILNYIEDNLEEIKAKLKSQSKKR